MRAQTIQIFLPKGEPRGIRQAEITTRTVRVFDIPRGELSSLPPDIKIDVQGIYFLLNTDEDSPRVYVGESDNVSNRLKQHLTGKDFWDRVVVAVSSSDAWTKAHLLLLEHNAIEAASKSRQYTLENSQAGRLSNVSSPLKADCEEYFETIEVLMSTLGYPVLAVPRTIQNAPESRTYFLTRTGIEATGIYENGTMTVLEGSSVKLGDLENSWNVGHRKRQEKLIASGVIGEQNGKIQFLKSHDFETPSGAAIVVLGAAANGWKEWHDASGAKLDERRQSVPATNEDF
jgi:hypothetical protein